jgi:DNA ligase 1
MNPSTSIGPAAELVEARGVDDGGMNRFAALLDRLVYEPGRNAKLRLITEYLRSTPDPERGWALAALTGALSFAHAKPGIVRALIAQRVDPVLFEMSYDSVGDLSETVALMWPRPGSASPARTPSLSEVVATLALLGKLDLPAQLAQWLDALDETGRWAMLKLVTGALRIGVSARLAKTAVAVLGNKDPNEVELIWPSQAPPYPDLFAWLEGRADKPTTSDLAPFRPVMLAHALEEGELGRLDPAAFIADGAIDGELLIMRERHVQSFNTLQQRLNRKTVTTKMLSEFPAHLRAYDFLFDNEGDVRDRPFVERRARLEALIGGLGDPRIDVSAIVRFATWQELAAARDDPAAFGAGEDAQAIEGVMLKRRDEPYLPGRPKGPWWKWKRGPTLIDAVLMYAQRGHGKRSSFYSDYTFGVWRGDPDGGELVPVGKAYFGFTDEELLRIDRFVRQNTISRFGPVREVVHQPDRGLVLEVAFEGLQRSPRHKSGLAMRFPRINRLRWDKPPAESDRLETLEWMLVGNAARQSR